MNISSPPRRNNVWPIAEIIGGEDKDTNGNYYARDESGKMIVLLGSSLETFSQGQMVRFRVSGKGKNPNTLFSELYHLQEGKVIPTEDDSIDKSFLESKRRAIRGRLKEITRFGSICSAGAVFWDGHPNIRKQFPFVAVISNRANMGQTLEVELLDSIGYASTKTFPTPPPIVSASYESQSVAGYTGILGHTPSDFRGGMAFIEDKGFTPVHVFNLTFDSKYQRYISVLTLRDCVEELTRVV